MDKVLGFGSSSGGTTIGDDIRKIKNEMNMVGLFVGACAGVCGIAVMNAIKVAENTREISEDGKKFAENAPRGGAPKVVQNRFLERALH